MCAHRAFDLVTRRRVEFVDVTDRIAELVLRGGLMSGIVNVQTRHTTTGIVLNEHEPLLLTDMREALDRHAPRTRRYRHDDLALRTANLQPGERRNGHAHCQALVLGASETLNVTSGRMQLGRWQRIFFVELDGGQLRQVSVMLLGWSFEMDDNAAGAIGAQRLRRATSGSTRTARSVGASTAAAAASVSNATTPK
jgi:secondary thiamine-phosphate synthase enzyme